MPGTLHHPTSRAAGSGFPVILAVEKGWDLGWWRGPGSCSDVVVAFHDSRALSKMEILGCAAWVRQQSPALAGEARNSSGSQEIPVAGRCSCFSQQP